MINTIEFLGGSKSLALVGGQVFKVTLLARWHYIFSSGAPSGPSIVQLPVSDNLMPGIEFTFTIVTGTTNPVRFTNGRTVAQNVYDKDGVVRSSVSTSTGQFGSEPVVRARLISEANGGLWTIWSVGDAG